MCHCRLKVTLCMKCSDELDIEDRSYCRLLGRLKLSTSLITIFIIALQITQNLQHSTTLFCQCFEGKVPKIIKSYIIILRQ